MKSFIHITNSTAFKLDITYPYPYRSCKLIDPTSVFISGQNRYADIEIISKCHIYLGFADVKITYLSVVELSASFRQQMATHWLLNKTTFVKIHQLLILTSESWSEILPNAMAQSGHYWCYRTGTRFGCRRFGLPTFWPVTMMTWNLRWHK